MCTLDDKIVASPRQDCMATKHCHAVLSGLCLHHDHLLLLACIRVTTRMYLTRNYAMRKATTCARPAESADQLAKLDQRSFYELLFLFAGDSAQVSRQSFLILSKTAGVSSGSLVPRPF